MRELLVRLVVAYQRYISPYKGFNCAYRVVTGGPSCSEAIKRIISAHGLVGGWSQIRRQFRSCKSIAIELNSDNSSIDESNENDEDKDQLDPIDKARKEKEEKKNKWSKSDCLLIPCADCSGATAAEGATSVCSVFGGGCDACACTPF